MLKSVLTKKLIFKVVVVLALLTVIAYGYFLYSKQDTIPSEYLLYLGALLTLAAVIIYKTEFARPFKHVLLQIKSLLTGKKYKKIITDRTDEIGVVAHFFNEVTTSFEKVSEQIREGKKVTGELEIAGQLQKELMPTTAPTIEGFDIAIKNRSAEELGGDNIDFIKVKDSFIFYVGDVTGHGVPAAIIMTMVNTLINAYAEIYDTAYEIVVNTNRRLKKRIRATMFMSMLMLKWNEVYKKMTYVGCGHEHLVIYRAKTRKCDVSVSGGIALGMIPNNSKIVHEKDIDLDEGDIIILYTDGITEAKNMKGEMYGLDRLVDQIQLYAADEDAQFIVQNIARDFSGFVEEHVQEDDVTLIAVKFLGLGKEGKAVLDHKTERWNDDKKSNDESSEKDQDEEKKTDEKEPVANEAQDVQIGDIKTKLDS